METSFYHQSSTTHHAIILLLARKCFENAFWHVCSAFQNLLLGGVILDKSPKVSTWIGGWHFWRFVQNGDCRKKGLVADGCIIMWIDHFDRYIGVWLDALSFKRLAWTHCNTSTLRIYHDMTTSWFLQTPYRDIITSWYEHLWFRSTVLISVGVITASSFLSNNGDAAIACVETVALLRSKVYGLQTKDLEGWTKDEMRVFEWFSRERIPK